MRLLGSPVGLIIFTGENLWPQLDALAQWADILEHVRIVVAHGDEIPGGSADRLACFIADFLPGSSVAMLDPIHDDEPAEVVAAIQRAADPDIAWLVDASGGTRLMFAGVLIARSHLTNIRVVYRDVPGPWCELLPGGAVREIEGTDPRAADRFTVEALLDVTWSDEERRACVLTAEVESPIEDAANATLAGSEWRQSFEDGVGRIDRRVVKQSAGRLFEQFVLCLVRGLGVHEDDVALSAILFDGAKSVQEVDVVVNSYGRLHVIDCKLLDGDTAVPMGVQIREAFTTLRQLGDGAAQYILLRPNLVLEEETRSLCRAYGIRVVDQVVLEDETLVDVLRRLIRPDMGNGIPTAPQKRPARIPIVGHTMDLRNDFLQSRESVRVYDHGPVIVVAISVGPGATSAHVGDAVKRRITGFGEVLNVSHNANRTSFTVTVRAYSKHRAEMRAALAGFDPADVGGHLRS